MQKKGKHQSVFTMNETNKRVGGWSSESMKRYNEVARVIKYDIAQSTSRISIQSFYDEKKCAETRLMFHKLFWVKYYGYT